MEWTKEKPTKPGYYWLRRKWYDDEPVKVHRYENGGEIAELVVREIAVDTEYDINDLVDEKWSGPIEPPK